VSVLRNVIKPVCAPPKPIVLIDNKPATVRQISKNEVNFFNNRNLQMQWIVAR
jgi:hypothetical protein